MLAIITVGEVPPPSMRYIGKKIELIPQAVHCPVEDTPQAPEEIAEIVSKAKGVILQLPTPHPEYLELIPPEKDVDGLTLANRMRFYTDQPPYFIPCTPKGILQMLEDRWHEEAGERDSKSESPIPQFSLSGKRVLVIGRSELVGRPLSILLDRLNATVTLAHSHTPQGILYKWYDIVVVAIGSPGFFDVGKMANKNAFVVDVGTTVVEAHIKDRIMDKPIREDSTKRVLIGDTFNHIKGTVTPVPGGVGPRTVQALKDNYMYGPLPIPLEPK